MKKKKKRKKFDRGICNAFIVKGRERFRSEVE